MSRFKRATCVLLALCCISCLSFAMGSIPAARAGDADTGGMQYANWCFGEGNLKEVTVVIQINSDLSPDDGVFFQAYDGFINGKMFYFGFQTRVGKPGYGLTGKGLIFSQFGTTDASSIKTAPNGWYEAGTYEGPFISTRVGYAWTTSRYAATIKYGESDAVGDWYEFWMEDLNSGSKMFAGALRFSFPTDQSKAGITDGGGTWTELYYRRYNGTPLPVWSVSILEVSCVCKDGRTLFPQNVRQLNADNFSHVNQVFHPETSTLDFLVGGEATKSFTSSDLTLSVGTVSVVAKLNQNSWSGSLCFELQREKANSFSTVPADLPNSWAGTYKLTCVSGGPPGATLTSITPSSVQTLSTGKRLEFTLDFTTPPSVCTIKASAGAGGTISPSGDVSMDRGSSQAFTITPDTGYHISDVVADGLSLGAVSTHAFTGVVRDHSIAASFEKDTGDTEPPVIVLADGIDGATVSRTIFVIRGKVTDNVGVTRLALGDDPRALEVTVSPDGSFSTSILLNEGDNWCTLVAYDAAGNKGIKRVSVTYQVPAKVTVVLTIGSTTATVDGASVILEAAPEIVGGRTFVPIRFIAETFGASVKWYPATRGIDITLDLHMLGLAVGSSTAVIDGRIATMEVAPYIKNGRTMVPLRLISEALGSDVAWDPVARTVTISYAP